MTTYLSHIANWHIFYFLQAHGWILQASCAIWTIFIFASHGLFPRRVYQDCSILHFSNPTVCFTCRRISGRKQANKRQSQRRTPADTRQRRSSASGVGRRYFHDTGLIHRVQYMQIFEHELHLERDVQGLYFSLCNSFLLGGSPPNYVYRVLCTIIILKITPLVNSEFSRLQDAPEFVHT